MENVYDIQPKYCRFLTHLRHGVREISGENKITIEKKKLNKALSKLHFTF